MSHLYNKNYLYQKATKYCKLNNSSINLELGHGTQGIVYQTSTNFAIKVYDREDGYIRERDVYKRLKERNILSIENFTIPRLSNFNDELFIIEMSIVHVPCILDFGGAYLDNPPEHANRSKEWFEEKEEEFGENWEKAKDVIRKIEHSADIYLADINTGNIKFEDN